jgi:hypothetical protein
VGVRVRVRVRVRVKVRVRVGVSSGPEVLEGALILGEGLEPARRAQHRLGPSQLARRTQAVLGTAARLTLP